MSESVSEHKISTFNPAAVGDQPYPSFEARMLKRYLSGWLDSDSIEKLFERAGVSESALAQDSITACQTLRLYDLAQQEVKTTGLGCRFGFAFDLNDFGELATVFSACDRLGDALAMVANYNVLFGTLTDKYEETIDGELVVRHLNTNRLSPELLQFVVEFGCSITLSIASQLIDKPIQLKEIAFSSDGSDEAARLYNEYFGCEVKFNQTVDLFKVDNSVLNEKIVHDSQTGAQSPANICEQLIQRMQGNDSLAQEVLAILSDQLSEVPKLDRLAAALDMSPRTLRRRLGEMDTSYQSLLNQVRCRMAIKILHSERRSTEDIAEQLGYTDVANFRHAIKRWLGVTPGEIANSIR